MLNLSKVTTQSDVIPPGKYTATVTGATLMDTKSGGKMIKTELTIAGPVQAGRKIWELFNIENSNPKATEIGLSQLKTLCVALGYTNDQLQKFEIEMLLNKSVSIETKIESDTGFGEKARVKKYSPVKTDQFTTTTEGTPF